MSDIALLGYAVDTSGLLRGEKALERYAIKAFEMETKVIKSISTINKSFSGIGKGAIKP